LVCNWGLVFDGIYSVSPVFFICVHAYTFMCMLLYICACEHVCVHIEWLEWRTWTAHDREWCAHTCLYIHTYIHTYIDTNLYTYIHTYIYTYIHTYVYASRTNKRTNNIRCRNRLETINEQIVGLNLLTQVTVMSNRWVKRHASSNNSHVK
jgi:hypothetical protein